MKRLKIEIQITILTLCIAVAVIVSGFLAYQSLSKIVDTIHKEARPDLKLLLIKGIAADLNEVENAIRLYSLTGDTTFLLPYRQLDISIHEKLSTLAGYVTPGSTEIYQIDSIGQLASRKLIIWDEIRALHHSKGDAHNTFSSLYSRIDTVIIQPDTIRFKKVEKKSFFKRIFSKNDTTTLRPIIIDKSKEKEIIKQEIAGIEKQITGQTRRLQVKEKVLFERNIQVTQILNQHIDNLEYSEQKRLETKTLEADFMAAQTYRRMAIFTITAVILLIVILIVFFRNIQQNQTYQQVLKKAKAEAESLTKAKEIFVATVSHEMRTPLNAIYGLTEQMLQKTDSNELKIIRRSAEHLIALVNDTLDFSKIESQTLKIEQIDFFPDEIMREIQTLHENPALKKGIKLIVINNTDKNLVLIGDPIRLKQILINLITNAIKFTDHGQITLAISVEETPDQNYLLKMEISDTGMGISQEDIHKIFDEFVQLDSGSTQKQRGAGLGLAIVKKLIILQNGKIDVDSTLGKGTRFTIQIPYRIGNPDNVRKRSAEILQIPPWFRKLHFLIVDDEEFNRYLIKNILTKWGVSYTESYNGRDAVNLAEKNSYDLILMDIRMPVMDGYEATKLILQQRPTSKIIALTATDKSTDIQKIQTSGIQTFLQKPFIESDLLNAIMKSLPKKDGAYNPEEILKNSTMDLEELERLSGGDATFFNEMLRIFIRSSEDALTKFKQNYDWITITETAHKLAAPAKHLKATSLYANLKKLETTTENSNPEETKKLIVEIEWEINHINSILKQKLKAE